MKSNRRMVILYVVFILIVVFAASMFANQDMSKNVTYSDVIRLFKEEKVTSFLVDEENNVILKLADNSKVTYKLKDVHFFREDTRVYIEEQYPDIITSYDYEPLTTLPWWVSFLPYVIVIVIMVVIW